MQIIFFAFLATLIQLVGAYLRYLPFRGGLLSEERKRLGYALFGWSLLGFGIMLLVLQETGLSLAAFRLIFLTGWVPYVAISLFLIKRPLSAHIFVFGMQALWAFTLQSFAGMVIWLLYGSNDTHLLIPHLLCYITLFALCYPLVRNIFTALLRNPFPKDRMLRLCISLLPSAVWLGAIFPIVRVTFLPDWGDRLTRLFLPMFFFLSYSIIVEAHHRTQQQRALVLANLRMEKKRKELWEQAKMLEENTRHISVLRHDLRHNYRLIHALLEAGDEENALRHIRAMKERFENKAADETAEKENGAVHKC